MNGGDKMGTSNIKLIGFDTLGIEGSEGIRYAWKHESSSYYVESAAFVQRTKAIKDRVCGYTTSVSSGCILKSMGKACKFCRTGKLLPYGGRLTTFEIAKQNVFMVLADMNCSDNADLRNKQREFAYMGQGEPGFSYHEIQLAIQLTNIVMKELGQTVFRHIIATSGVPQMIKEYVNDLKNDFFSSRTTLHFSLHGTINRSEIMPINSRFSYKESLNAMSEISVISGEKPCIGILLLNNFKPLNSQKSYTTDFNTVKDILKELDPSRVRLSFCEFNGSLDIGTYDVYEEKLSNEILDYAKRIGFEAKLFSSFGRKEVTACGMLGGRKPQEMPSEKWIELEREAEELILSATNKLEYKGEISR